MALRHPPRKGFGGAVRAHFAPLAADGGFALDPAPAGSFVLRVGTELELASGEPQLSLPIEILPGESPPLELALR